MAEASFGDSFTEDLIGLKVNASQLSLGKGTKTASATAGAATLHQPSGVITSESLTTAQNADYTLTITNNKVAASDIVQVTIGNGTNSAGSPVLRTVAVAADTITVVIRNMHASAVAFNGTLKVYFSIMKV